MDFLTALKTSTKVATAAPRKIWNRHDSAILTGISIVATGAAVFFALKDGPKAKKILEEKRAQGANNLETAKALLPVCGRTMMAVAVAWGTSLLNHKRMSGKVAVLAEALSVANSLREETRQATVDEVGEEKAKEIEKKVSSKMASEKPVVLSEVETTGHGQFIFREPMTGKTFRASKDYVELVVSRYSDEISRMHRMIKDGDLDPDSEDLEFSMNEIFTDGFGLSGCGFAKLFVWRAKEHCSINVDLHDTFEYEGPDGTKEPAYILDFYGKPTLAYSSYSSDVGRRY